VESEHNEVDGMKKGVDSKGEVRWANISVLNDLFILLCSCCFSLCDVVIFEQRKMNK